MDVAKYIGLFILKNHFCYIQGLGNLEMKKRPASYDGRALHAASYDVLLVPAGSLDDSLANFIATNEQISISKASNALREYSLQAKADLQAGKDVVIPSIGKFADVEGKTTFVTDPKLQYTTPAIPVVRLNKRDEAAAQVHTSSKPASAYQPTATAATAMPTYQPSYEDETGSRLNWGRIILVAVIVLAFIGLNIAGYMYYFKPKKPANIPVTVQTPPATDTPKTQPVLPITADTTVKVTDTATVPAMLPESNIAVKNNILYYKVILNTYYSKEKAERRYKQLRGNGTKVELVAEDSLNYYIVLPVHSASRDTSRILDSLSTLYNPNGVSIY